MKDDALQPTRESQPSGQYVGSLDEELSNERFLEAEEDYPFDVESEEGRYGR
jgi:hypothetical protein